MSAVDTHCHLQMKQFDDDRENVLEHALACLDWLVVVGDGISGCEGMLELLQPRVFGTVGFHPYHAAEYDDDAESRLTDFAAHPGVVAIGETGLDYFNEFAPRAAQRVCFERQLALAARLNLPAVIHCRSADEDAFAILKEHVPHLPGCIMHCFGGTVAFAEQCVELGCHISFAGNVTFPKAETLREAARIVPSDKILAETDAPYLAPQSVRGKRCEPAHILHTIQFLAKLRKETMENFSTQMVSNACRVFGQEYLDRMHIHGTTP